MRARTASSKPLDASVEDEQLPQLIRSLAQAEDGMERVRGVVRNLLTFSQGTIEHRTLTWAVSANCDLPHSFAWRRWKLLRKTARKARPGWFHGIPPMGDGLPEPADQGIIVAFGELAVCDCGHGSL